MSTTPDSRPRRLRRAEASAYLKREHDLGYAPRTLAKMATIGGGPVMIYANRIPYYPTDELDRWARARLSPPVRSTSELRTLQAA